MRRSRGLWAVLFNMLFVASLLALAAALAHAGTGLAAIAAIFVALPAFFLQPSGPRVPVTVPARRRPRAPLSR